MREGILRDSVPGRCVQISFCRHMNACVQHVGVNLQGQLHIQFTEFVPDTLSSGNILEQCTRSTLSEKAGQRQNKCVEAESCLPSQSRYNGGRRGLSVGG